MTIVQRESGVLRKLADDVPLSKIRSLRIKKIIKMMKDALDSQTDGVAIAAPQIGESLRIFVVSEKVFDLSNDVQERRSNPIDAKKKYGHIVFINPLLTKLSKKKRLMEEGCLSVRYLYGKVPRSEKASVKAYDDKGNAFERGASGLLAQVFQHEVDHLNGILFIDSARDLREVKPEEIIRE